MLKKIVLDWLLPAVAIGVVVVAGIFIAQKLGILGGGQATPPTEIRTVDTPEYKRLDSLYQEQGKQVAYLLGRVDEMAKAYDQLAAQKQQITIKYKNEDKRIENNTANSNFDELWGIIQSRRSK